MIWGIQSAQVPEFAPRLEPFLRNFADRSFGRWTVPGIFESLATAKRQAWVANDFDAVCLTAITGATCEIQAAAGSDREIWQDEGTEMIEAWAKAQGAKHMAITCRPGWAKHFRARGYREAHREYVRSI